MGLSGATSVLLAGYALWVEPRWIKVRTLRLPIDALPPGLDGLSLVHLSDFHLGPHVPLDLIQRAVQKSNRLSPDLVLLTGDYVSDSPDYVDPVCEALSSLSARAGVFACLGNHDHWEDADRTRKGLARAGIALLENEHKTLRFGGDMLVVAGVEDLWEGDPDVELAFEGAPDQAIRILLSHNPDAVKRLGQERVDLMLCGHTHGGQVRLPAVGAPLLGIESGPALASGLSRTDRGTAVYVNQGLGVISPPVRFLCRPEIAHILLVRSG